MTAKIGRPLSDKPKTNQITIRLDDEGICLLEKCCDISKQSKSDVLRKGLDLYAQQFIKSE